MTRQEAATFTEVPGPVPGVRRFILDCRHGTTTGEVVGDTRQDIPVLELLVAKHRIEEPTCRCILLQPEGLA